MTALAAAIELMKYGGSDLRKNYRKYLTRAFVIATALHIVILGGFWIAQHWGESNVKTMPMVHLKLADLAPPPSLQQTAQEQVTAATPVAKPSVGVPVPVPDAEVSPEQTFATLNQITQAGPVGDSAGLGAGGGVNVIPEPAQVTQNDDQSGMWDFVPVEQEPVPVTNIYSVIKYPELARKAGLEGKVEVRFQVLKDGAVGKVVVVKSDQKIFDQAAIDALKQCKFTPAIQNKQPIDVWASQVIEFKLK